MTADRIGPAETTVAVVLPLQIPENILSTMIGIVGDVADCPQTPQGAAARKVLIDLYEWFAQLLRENPPT